MASCGVIAQTLAQHAFL